MQAEAVNRPVDVTALCSILLAGGVFNIIYTFTGVYAPFGLLYSAGHTLLIIVMFAAISGIWNMEKWGVYVFTVCIVLKLMLDLYTGAFRTWELVLLLPVAVFFFRLRMMK